MTNWRRRANCLGLDPELFFPSRGGSLAEARRVCRSCVVQTACLDEAVTVLVVTGLSTRRAYGSTGKDGVKSYPVRGVWGGTSERERRQLRRQRASA